ncbi:MAG: cytochrome c, class I [Gammaproteobacteria bacterium]|nr:cytochrome c, class I [Gammaproteobacteria bacterium]MDH5614592.1 cytochrome c, class I [Gammaproteobacteria bacterium]
MSNTQKDTIVKKKSVEKPDVNRFNRLLKKGGEVHLAPIEDGIHDPTNRAARMLQNPKEALFGFPEAKAGNEVDWVKAMDSGKIKPLNSYDGKEVMPIVMDLNIVMEVKGSMPNVVFPHKQHTTILDCANCHPAIFTPLSGSNNITMAENLMGKKCGVCHGKVAFPLSKCSSCHSGEK